MTREQLIQLLKEYNENVAKLELRRRERKMLELRINADKELETNITNSYGLNNDIRSKNSTSDKVGNAVIDKETQREEDKKRLEEVNNIITELENKVAEVDIRLKGLKYKEREILYAYYADNRTAEDISCNLYFKLFNRTCSPRYIQKIIQNSTERILKL